MLGAMRRKRQLFRRYARHVEPIHVTCYLLADTATGEVVADRGAFAQLGVAVATTTRDFYHKSVALATQDIRCAGIADIFTVADKSEGNKTAIIAAGEPPRRVVVPVAVCTNLHIVAEYVVNPACAEPTALLPGPSGIRD